MHNARQAFIKSESSEKISCALCHNLRSYKDAIFVTGDSVYYKRNDSKGWKGPGKVIGVDGQQILVKHGSTYIRSHPSHVTLKDEKSSNRSFTNNIHADENASKSSTTDMAANKRCGNISNQSENNPTSTESHPDICQTVTMNKHRLILNQVMIAMMSLTTMMLTVIKMIMQRAYRLKKINKILVIIILPHYK